ncbi:MAG: hypothetical protein IJX17_03360 [Clostridia bacterium]|nr:hypothetical protein [Clostridia bacterium]
MLFQNKYVKQLKKEINQRLDLTKKRYEEYSFYQNIENGRISFSFYRSVIGIIIYFNDEIPDEMQDTIFKLSIEKEKTIHQKCKCGALGYDYIEFNFYKETLKELTCDDLIKASNNLKEFFNQFVIQHLVKPDYN